MKSSTTLRAFVALEFNPEGMKAIERVAVALRSRIDSLAPDERAKTPRIRWSPPSQWHITLKFLGSMDAALVPQFSTLLRPLAQQKAPRIKLGAISGFPSSSRAQVLAVRARDLFSEVERLRVKVEEGAKALGFPPEERKFRPHVTIARFKNATDLSEWPIADFAKEEVTLSSLTLFRSDPGPNGSVYTSCMTAEFR